MLFNSYEFIFVFLPIVVAVFFALGRASRAWAMRWVIAASLFFYGWWRPLNLLIIAPSVLINFVLARVLQRLCKQGSRRAARAVLLVGIAFNVAFLDGPLGEATRLAKEHMRQDSNIRAVMTGLVPVMRPNASAFGDVVKPPERFRSAGNGAAWMAGTSPAMTERAVSQLSAAVRSI